MSRSFRIVLIAFAVVSMLGEGQAVSAAVSAPEAMPILARFRAEYEPVAREARGRLSIEIDAASHLVVASARRDSVDQFQVVVDAGLLESPRLTPDSLRITVCHELGHLFGGAPLRPVPPEWDGPVDASGMSLLSAEGQADYYATQVCFRRMVKGDDQAAALNTSLRGRPMPESVGATCDRAWPIDNENRLICRRAAIAAFDFLNMVKDFPISLERHDPSVVRSTIIAEYPGRQCRLDTLVAGATCADDRAPCRGSLPAGRPACWFVN